VQQSALRFMALFMRAHHPDPQTDFAARVHRDNYAQFVLLATMAREGGLAQPIIDAILFLKGKAVKRQPLTNEQRRAPKFTPPPSTSKAVARVRAILKEIVDRQYEALVDQFTKQYQGFVTGFIAKQKEADKDPTLTGFEYRSSRRLASYYSVEQHSTFVGRDGQTYTDQTKVTMLRIATKTDYAKGEYRVMVKANAMVLMAEEAVKKAKEIRDLFVVKNLKKFVAILEGKGDDLFASAREINGSVSLGGLRGEFEIVFTDGSSFEAKNAVVWVMNSFGTQFNRFPLTFHNVKLAGGGAMKSPSEKRMNTVFLGKE
jgi:hypothetical protein